MYEISVVRFCWLFSEKFQSFPFVSQAERILIDSLKTSADLSSPKVYDYFFFSNQEMILQVFSLL